MTCDRARELLTERETRALQSLLAGAALEPGDEALAAHLAGCPSCRRWAEQLLQLDDAAADHVEAFAERGDFAKEWAQARATVAEIRRRPIHRTFFGVAALAALFLFVTRVALLPRVPLPIPPPKLDLPPITSPALPTEPAAEPPIASSPPLPAPSPAPMPARPSPPRTASPKPARAEPRLELPPSPSPPATSVDRRVTVEIDPAVRADRLSLICPSGSLVGRRSGRTFTFEAVPGEPCSLEVDGALHRGVAPGLDRYRLALIGGSIALLGG